ncbi:unnamed protein product [Vitrella brassicaformis CCMP3155]|uniref:Thioredoxin domain-containing protein n=4 Tax=Vitrella brassicaformis TaxID=1169539 RepID=A0A0G4E8P0_VITBC|nr:unnamed protein product [Vitrella brassicaformis CCMP3155]|eukprot:CEL91887.1 unnamed protein product [Vitrella brassicaformis CCMP3155]
MRASSVCLLISLLPFIKASSETGTLTVPLRQRAWGVPMALQGREGSSGRIDPSIQAGYYAIDTQGEDLIEEGEQQAMEKIAMERLTLAAANWLRQKGWSPSVVDAAVREIGIAPALTSLQDAAIAKRPQDVAVREAIEAIGQQADSLLTRQEQQLQRVFEDKVTRKVRRGVDEQTAREGVIKAWQTAAGVGGVSTRRVMAMIRRRTTSDPDYRSFVSEGQDSLGRTTATLKGKGRAAAPASGGGRMPEPAEKNSVIFEPEESELQRLVIESPVPVLIDVYADWCGPCQQLKPILEDVVTQFGGMFRLVKINSDKHKSLSQCLEVEGLPTLLSVIDGDIVEKSTGVGGSDQLQALITRLAQRQPELSQKEKLQPVSRRFSSMCGRAAFGFAKSEKLDYDIKKQLDQLLKAPGMTSDKAQETVRILSIYLKNVARHPQDPKYRRINLLNAKAAETVAPYPPALAILRLVGFQDSADVSAGAPVAMSYESRNLAPVTAAYKTLTAWKAKQVSGDVVGMPIPLPHRHRAQYQQEERGVDVEEHPPETTPTAPAAPAVMTTPEPMPIAAGTSQQMECGTDGVCRPRTGTPLPATQDEQQHQPSSADASDFLRRTAMLRRQRQEQAEGAEATAVDESTSPSQPPPSRRPKLRRSPAAKKEATLWSSGILQSDDRKGKGNLYFGGDSTLVEAPSEAPQPAPDDAGGEGKEQGGQTDEGNDQGEGSEGGSK